jgi:ribosomal-protein-alanine N-acetyltransferase
MNSPVELVTERTRLWLPHSNEAAAVLSFFTSNYDFHEPTSPYFPEGFYTDGYWAERLELSRQEFERDQSLRLFLALKTEPTKVIGMINLNQIIRGPFQACYLGYSLSQDAEGKGLMTEALSAVIPYAFETLCLHRIMANYLPENERSAKVLKGLGFKIDGRTDEYLYIRGKWREHVLTSLTNPFWKPRETDKFLFEPR